MARKKLRMPSPSPPPATPPREESTSDEEAEAEATPATQKAPQIAKPQSSDAADTDSSDGGEEESSDSETDANPFKLREVAPSSGKPSESGAADEDGSSSESPEPIQNKARGKKPKAEAAAGKKRQVAESTTPSGGKAKKAKADVEKPASEPNASSKKQREKAVPSKPAVRRWTIEGEIKVPEALVSHVKAHGTQSSAVQLIDALGDTLERKNCTKTEMYEKVRNLKQRHEKAATTGTLPGNEDDLRKFNLSEAVWGETAKEVAALTMSQNDAAASSKGNKGQINKEKAKEADTPVKSKKRGNHKEELENDAKAADITKETTNTATQNGGLRLGARVESLTKRKKMEMLRASDQRRPRQSLRMMKLCLKMGKLMKTEWTQILTWAKGWMNYTTCTPTLPLMWRVSRPSIHVGRHCKEHLCSLLMIRLVLLKPKSRSKE